MRTNTSPIVAVVVPCYDVPADILSEAIGSILAQSIDNWEAIIVDDGGLDFSLDEMLTSIDDPRLRAAKHHGNRGLGAARNTGIELASAPIAAMLDADDVLRPDYLSTMVEALPESPDRVWLWPDMELIGAASGEWRYPDPPVELCPAHLSYSGGSSLIPVSLWREVGGFVEDPLLGGLEDLDFWLGALGVGARPIYVHELLYQWRIAHDSMTFKASPDSYLQMREIYDRRRSVFDTATPCPECGGTKPRPVFLSRGYFNSSVHARRSGRRLRSLALGLRALSLNPRDVSVRRHLQQVLVTQRLVGRGEGKS